jgi:hypothetical protein
MLLSFLSLSGCILDRSGCFLGSGLSSLSLTDWSPSYWVWCSHPLGLIDCHPALARPLPPTLCLCPLTREVLRIGLQLLISTRPVFLKAK